MRLLVALLVWLLRATLFTRGSLAVENLSLRQQLATYARGRSRPRLKSRERAFWVALSRVWSEWCTPLVFVKPATVIAWHRRGFQRYWRWRSRKPGEPRIPAEHIAFIRRISNDQPGWGEDRIAEELAIKLGVHHSTSTIRRYMVQRQEPRGGQTWKTFISNYASQIFACDFLTQPTTRLTIVYIFIVMETASRRIVLINVTSSPGPWWVQQQLRQATAWAQSPPFLIHDHDGIFGQYLPICSDPSTHANSPYPATLPGGRSAFRSTSKETASYDAWWPAPTSGPVRCHWRHPEEGGATSPLGMKRVCAHH